MKISTYKCNTKHYQLEEDLLPQKSNREVYVVMAREDPKDFRTCYAVCDSRRTAQSVIDKDHQNGDIQAGATIEPHVMQTKEMV